MTTRRTFLGVMAGGVAAAALPRLSGSAEAGSAPFGLQLYSLRDHLKGDVPGTLAKVKAMGIVEVEAAGYYGMPVEAFAGELEKLGLACRAAHFPFERVRDDLAAVVREAKALGATFVVTPWIPHEGNKFTPADAQRAADVFNKATKEMKGDGLRFAYHLHGYEFEPSPEGTLFDTLAARTAEAGVEFEVDVLWAKAGGADPAKLIETYAGRVPLTHLKDMAKGTPHGQPGAKVSHEQNVVAGTGELDFPAILRASAKAGVVVHYIEDESPRALEQIPQSLAYLKSLKL